MDGWYRDANGDRDVLERIVALLFALAGLADLAAGLPARHRRQVLAILGYGEAVARAFLTGMEEDAPSWEDAPADAPGEPGDALLLAARFRALALLLAALLARAALFALTRAASLTMDKAERLPGGQRPRPLHHAPRGPPASQGRIWRRGRPRP
jgi:hypothetical protein